MKRHSKPKEIGKIHGAYSHDLENKILFAMVPTVARYVTANQLSFMALAGAAVMSYSIFMAGYDLNNLWWLPVGVLMHWFGDGLDGKVARERNESRPRYGYYIDRIFDDISTAVILASVDLSRITNTEWWLYVLVLVLMLWSHLFLKASVTGMFEMNIGRFGGLELKGMGMVVMVLLLVTKNPVFLIDGVRYTLMDIMGMVVSLIMLAMFIYAVATSLTGKNKIKD